MGRFSLLVVLIHLLLATPALARDGESSPPRSTLSEVEARLAAEDPGVAAWGAYFAGRDGHRSAALAIRDLLRRHVEPFDRDWNLAHRAAFDALIRLDEEVDDGLLGRHERRFPLQVLVLRAQRPERHVDALHSLFERCLEAATLGHYGLAVGNLVVAAQPCRVASTLLTRVRMRLTLRVETPGAAPSGALGLGGGVRGGFGDGLARVPRGFPPYVDYSLWDSAGPGRELLARGPRSVWSRRSEQRATGVVGHGALAFAATETCCLEWLSRLLDQSVDELGIVPQQDRVHAFSTPDAYLAFATEARDALLAPWWKVAVGLRRADLMTGAEVRALEPSLTLRVEDERVEREPALPALPPAERPASARQP